MAHEQQNRSYISHVVHQEDVMDVTATNPFCRSMKSLPSSTTRNVQKNIVNIQTDWTSIASRERTQSW